MRRASGGRLADDWASGGTLRLEALWVAARLLYFGNGSEREHCHSRQDDRQHSVHQVSHHKRPLRFRGRPRQAVNLRRELACSGRPVVAWLTTGPMLSQRVRLRVWRCWGRRQGGRQPQLRPDLPHHSHRAGMHKSCDLMVAMWQDRNRAPSWRLRLETIIWLLLQLIGESIASHCND